MLGAVLFMVGIICIALKLTYFFTLDWLLLAGIIIAGGGIAFSRIFREL